MNRWNERDAAGWVFACFVAGIAITHLLFNGLSVRSSYLGYYAPQILIGLAGCTSLVRLVQLIRESNAENARNKVGGNLPEFVDMAYLLTAAVRAFGYGEIAGTVLWIMLEKQYNQQSISWEIFTSIIYILWLILHSKDTYDTFTYDNPSEHRSSIWINVVELSVLINIVFYTIWLNFGTLLIRTFLK